MSRLEKKSRSNNNADNWSETLQRAGSALSDRNLDEVMRLLDLAYQNCPTKDRNQFMGFNYVHAIPDGVIGLAHYAVEIYHEVDAAYQILNFVEEHHGNKSPALVDTWFELAKEAVKEGKYEDAPEFFKRCRDSQNPQKPRIKFVEFGSFCHTHIYNLMQKEQYADAAGTFLVIMRSTQDPEVHMLAQRLAARMLDEEMRKERATYQGITELGKLISKY